ncbi:BspA family leucine-rich repeat surface protein, partial [Campylobacter jejuni]|uniref:BspA family leucine-rich repeat surface protein n=1 Tax=Campylobacter jejuni TaxID=197 RepID=UPI0011AA8BE1
DAVSFNQPLNDWNVSNVKIMSAMFYKASKFNQALDKWDTSKVTDMSTMFYEAKNFNQNLDNWNTDKLEYKKDAFKSSALEGKPPVWLKGYIDKIDGKFKYYPKTWEELNDFANDESINLGDINTSKITNMKSLFLRTTRKDFSGIDKWDTSNVTNMSDMFAQAKNFNQNINSWDVSKVENMAAMFQDAVSFNQPLNDWNVSNVKIMSA